MNLEAQCDHIEYVLVDEDDKVYTIGASKELFRYLRRFETFCKWGVSDFGENAIQCLKGNHAMSYCLLGIFCYN